ncbi:olfactory receptor 10A2-like [Hyla sarda]|uniref:olfactory receptor 10A2-like n=1 Tax=Hyla sarda TaxID=327740 RepID=UPI0024C32155|nr:olfactory receptor 10A2-like [Hyla sarda]
MVTLLQYASSLRMDNTSRLGSPFVFLGFLEMERYWIPYSIVALGLYLIPTMLCCLIVYVIWVEESLHEPMYVFISNLLLNGVFGNSVIFPQVIVYLLSGSSTISFPGCITQTFCVQTFSAVEIFTFTTMAYDRYLAVGNPLRYSSLVTNTKALKYIIIIWASAFAFVLVPVIMTNNLHFCGVNINNIFCDNMSLVRLACGDTSVTNIFGLVETLLILVVTLLVIFYCYIRTLLICLKTSGSTSHKAVNTLVTHILTFSAFMTASLFVLLRYRLNGGTISITVHVLLSITGVLSSVIVNPIIYGLRTEALKIKMIYILQKSFRMTSKSAL